MLRRPPRSTQSRSSAASDVYKRQSWRPRVGGRDWRRSRDSNPGRSLTPLNRLAGGCLQPLGHFSAQGGRPGRRGHLVLSLIHISEPTRLGMISYAVFCLKKKTTTPKKKKKT